MAASDTAERPDIQEQYQTANNTSNLTVEADRKGAGDLLIAAGWSPSRVGMALLRLHSEWDSAAKPRRPGEHLIEALAATIKAEDAQAVKDARRRGDPPPQRGAAMPRAHDRAQAWYVAELRLLAVSLKSRAVVWEQLEHWRALKGIDPQTVAEALLHWLSPKCPHCDGHGFMKAADSPALGSKRCHHCHGTGEVPRPEGTTVILNFLDDATNKARTSLKRRLHQRG